MSEMKIRFFSIADFREEEEWLREQHKKGWKLVEMHIPCFYYFEKCDPEDVVYRLDYKNGKADSTYKQMFMDYGWEYFEDCMGWLYFRKPVSEMESEEEMEIFSDTESKLNMIEHIVKTRMLPLLVIFLCCVIPNITRVFRGQVLDGVDIAFGIVYGTLFVLYVYLLTHCGLKFEKMRRELMNEE